MYHSVITYDTSEWEVTEIEQWRSNLIHILLNGMSYREFVPAAQRGTSSTGDETILSVKLRKPLDRSTSEPFSSWFSETRGDFLKDGESHCGYTAVEAIELVDGPSCQSGMNSSAASWTPPSLHHGGQTLIMNCADYNSERGNEISQHESFEEDVVSEDYIEPMTEVIWNSRSYFVPESIAYAYQEGHGYPHSLEVCHFYPR